MATRTEIMDVIANGESSRVEFKRDDIRVEDLARSLVAFSNLEGGMVLLGVEDDGVISGLVRDNVEEWVMTACRDKIRPAIIPFFEILRDLNGGQNLAVIRVPQGYSVHTLWHNNSNKYLIRVGTQNREPSQEELVRLFQRRGAIRAEMLPVSGALLKDLHMPRLRNYFADVRAQQMPADGDEPAWQALLANTEIMNDDCVTMGGMLLFGSIPNRYLPHAGIHAVAYPGTEKDYNAQERTELRGAMTPLRNPAGDTVDNGLVEQAVNFVQRNTQPSAELVKGQRIDRPAYPEDVVREVVVNALVHRDYLFSHSDIELSLYSDRLEVISPGALPNGVTPARIRAGVRIARNQLLREVMRDYRYIEGAGMGIPRTVINGMLQHNGKEPDLLDEPERFIVRLHA